MAPCFFFSGTLQCMALVIGWIYYGSNSIFAHGYLIWLNHHYTEMPGSVEITQCRIQTVSKYLFSLLCASCPRCNVFFSFHHNGSVMAHLVWNTVHLSKCYLSIILKMCFDKLSKIAIKQYVYGEFVWYLISLVHTSTCDWHHKHTQHQHKRWYPTM